MAKRSSPSNRPTTGAPSAAVEINAEARFRLGIEQLKNQRKELKLEYARGLRDEAAEEKRREKEREALLGRMLCQDVLPERKAIVAAYIEGLTKDADRALFGLPPLPTPPQANTASIDVHPTPDVDPADAGEAVSASPVHTPSEDTAALDNPPAAAIGIGRLGADHETADVELSSATAPHPDEGAARHTDDDIIDGSARGIAAVEATAGALAAADVSPTPVAPTDVLSGLGGGRDGAISAAANTASEPEPPFIPCLFLSSYEVREKIARLGLKPRKQADGRWAVMADSAEQAGHLVDLGLKPYPSK